MDLYRAVKPNTEQRTLVMVGRIVAIVSILIAIFITKPFLENFQQGSSTSRTSPGSSRPASA